MTEVSIPEDHPRALSLRIREKLIAGYNQGIVAVPGLIAQGRGEAFDYLLGEKTSQPASEAIVAAAATILEAQNAVISVNGNTAALVGKDIVELAQFTGTKIEVNLFYRSLKREKAIQKLLTRAGAAEILGVGRNSSAIIPELNSERRRVDPNGILTADVVIVPLEDGDRTEALRKMGKTVIAVDLNPLSRTSQKANITIVDNIVRCLPELVRTARKLKRMNAEKRKEILKIYDNDKILAQSFNLINRNLSKLTKNKHKEKVGK